MNLPIKYRPQSFEDVTGQEHVTKTLQNALRLGKISSAYLFSGPRGIGKTTIARIFAKGLNCETGITPTPCNKCRACREIQESRSLDVLEIDGASNRGIDDVRDLREKILYAPPTGRYRVVIIDEVHMLSTPAFNALLKTLEEPPPHVVFIFATTEPQKVPETVLSRTLRFDLRPLTKEQIKKRLKSIAKKEGIEVKEDALDAIAEHSRGSLRDALVLLEQLDLFAEKIITKQHVLNLLGNVDETLYERILIQIKKRDLKGLFTTVDEEIIKRGIPIDTFVDGLSHSLMKLLASKQGIMDSRFKEISKMFETPDILGLLNLSLEMEREVKRTMMPIVWLNFYLAKMAYLPSYVDIGNILRKSGISLFDEEGDRDESGTAPRERMELVQKKEAQFVSFATIDSSSESSIEFPKPTTSMKNQKGQKSEGTYVFSFDSFVSAVKERYPLIGTLLSTVNTVIDDGSIVISVEDPFQKDFLEDHREELEMLMKELSLPTFQLKIQIEEKNNLYTQVNEDPWLERFIEDLDMEVVEDV